MPEFHIQMTPSAPAEYWRREARRTASRVNRAWWLQAFAPCLVVVTAVAFGVIFWRRSQNVVLDFGLTAAVCALAVAGAGAAAWWFARKKFVSWEAALVTLDSRLHLHNALSAAQAGRAPWPAPPAAAVDDGFRWSWRWIGGPATAAAGLLIAAFFLPIPRSLDASVPPMVQPLSWPEMQQWLEKLEEESVIDPAQLEQLSEKLNDLQAQKEKDWYSHESLEATDSLRQSLDRSIKQLGVDMGAAERSLRALEQFSDQLTADSKDRLAADFQAALDGLRANELKLDPELMKRLASLDPKNLKPLSQEQLDRLRENLKKNMAACQACQNAGADGRGFLGDGEGEDDAEMAMLMKLLAGQKEGPGRGGINRGPGAAPLFLGEEESRLGTNRQEAATNDDLSRAAPADLVGIGEQEHELDTTPVQARAGGVADSGQGGERVSKDALTPAERAVLKRYFK